MIPSAHATLSHNSDRACCARGTQHAVLLRVLGKTERNKTVSGSLPGAPKVNLTPFLRKIVPDTFSDNDRDRPHLKIAASLFVEFRAAPAKLSRLTAMLAALGMSPADASRVTVPPKRACVDFD